MTEEDLFLALEQEMGKVDVDDVVDMSKLTNRELLDIWSATEAELLEREQILFPRDQQARDASSLREAAMLTFKKRTGVYPKDFPRDP